MALPRKKSRSLTFRGRTYRWMVGRRSLAWYERPDTMTAPTAAIRLGLVIEAESGALVIAHFAGLFALAVPSAGFADVQDLALTPGVAAQVLEHALDRTQWDADDRSARLELHDATRLFPTAMPHSDCMIDLGFDPSRLDQYLEGAVLLWSSDS